MLGSFLRGNWCDEEVDVAVSTVGRVMGEFVSVGVGVNVVGVATLQNAKDSEISFLNSGKYSAQLQESKAGFCFLR